METFMLALITIFIFFFPLISILLQSTKHPRSKDNNILPPEPPFLPIIGHNYILRKQPVPISTLAKLYNKYGPIMSLRFGSHRTLVVSSAALAKECFNGTNDLLLANRPKTLQAKYLGYNYTTLGMCPYGKRWQNLRRVFSDQLTSSSQLNSDSFVRIRKEEVQHLLLKLSSNNEGHQHYKKVELRSMFWATNFHILFRMITGKEHDYSNDKVKRYEKLVQELRPYSGFGNGGILFPIALKWKASNRETKIEQGSKRIDSFFQRLIDEQRSDEEKVNSMINNLLSLQESESEFYTDEMIKGIFVDVLFTPPDSLTLTLEWAMANIVNNPQVLKKATEEIDAQVGQERMLDETDLEKLHYLQSIIRETFRLNPALHLLAPHKSLEECNVGGYRIPRGTMVAVNAFAIHRDPEAWEDPDIFKPERFEEAEVKLLTFGLGRRACPGARLSHRMIGLCVGSLIQCFEWKRVNEKEIDMSQREQGNHLAKAKPLEVMCKARSIICKGIKDID